MIVNGYKCPCKNKDQQLGRYINPSTLIIDQTLQSIEKVTGVPKIISCPWNSFYEPIVDEIAKLKRAKEAGFHDVLHSGIPNLLYEAFIFHESLLKKLQYETEKKMIEKSKSKTSSSPVANVTKPKGQVQTVKTMKASFK